MINPLITSFEGKLSQEEGCLSIPGISETVKEATKFQLNTMTKIGKTR